RAVEAHPVVERRLHLARGDREALQVPLDVREPEEQELDPLVLDPPEHALPRLGIARRPRLALDLRHARSFPENTKAPGASRARGPVASKNALSLPQPEAAAPRAPARGRGARSRGRRDREPARSPALRWRARHGCPRR